MSQSPFNHIVSNYRLPAQHRDSMANTHALQSGQRHILRALSQWPKDTIRPEVQFQTVLQKRFEQPKLNLSEEEQLRQANALYSLLENRYKRTVSVYIPVHACISQRTNRQPDADRAERHC